jgi:predicted RNase H-like nuclease
MVGAVLDADGAIQEIGCPTGVRYDDAATIVQEWRGKYQPSSTLILLDQPTIVKNGSGQRPVEQIVCSCVGKRRGGVQPAHLGRSEMFGRDAPVWAFISKTEGSVDVFDKTALTRVVETYPVLAMIAMDWVLPDDERSCGRLPKYNPERATFVASDWAHVCTRASVALRSEGATNLAAWTESLARLSNPTKSVQDGLDACVCLLVASRLARGADMLFVGSDANGYMVVPHSDSLQEDLICRCGELGRSPGDWVRRFRLDNSSQVTGA